MDFLTTMGEYVKADALPDAFNISGLSIAVGMVIAAVVVFILGSWMAKKSKGSVSSQV